MNGAQIKVVKTQEREVQDAIVLEMVDLLITLTGREACQGSLVAEESRPGTYLISAVSLRGRLIPRLG